MSQAADPIASVADLIRRYRSAELSRVGTMLGAGERGDGLRAATLEGATGMGTTSFVRQVEATWPDGAVVSLDARRHDRLRGEEPGGDDRDVAVELRARRAAARLVDTTAGGRVLLTVDHAWEDDVAASLYAAVVDLLDEEADVSVLLVRRSDGGDTGPGTWDELLAEIGKRRPMPAIALSALPDEAIDQLVAIEQPSRSVVERVRIVELAGGVPAIASMLSDAPGIPDSLLAWVRSRLDRLDEDHRDAVLTLSLLEDGIDESAVGVDPEALPFARQRPDGSWSVEPPAIRHAIRESATSARRRAVAAEAEERLAASEAPDAPAGRASLLALRGDRTGSRRTWTAHADSLELAGDLEHAAAARRHAIAMSVSVDEQLESVAAAARTVREQGLRSPSEDLLLRVRRLATAVGDDERIAWSIHELAYTRQDLSLLDDPTITGSSAGWALQAQVHAAHVSGDYERMAELASRAIGRARVVGDEHLELAARHRLVGAAVLVPPDSPFAIPAEEAASQLAAVVERAWALGARNRALLAAATEGFVLRFTARFDLLVDRMQDRADLARRAGRPNHAVSLAAYEVEGLTELGRLEDAAELLARIEREADRAYDDGYVSGFLGLGALMLALESGVEARIRERHRRLEESGSLRMHASLAGVYELVRLREALELRDLGEAATRAAAYADADDDDLATAAADVARVVASSDDPDLRDAALHLRRKVPHRAGAAFVELCLAEADACLSPQPLGELPIAADAWRAHGCELRALRIEVLVATLHPDVAVGELRDLKARLRRAGMRGAEDRVNTLIRDRGGRAVARARPRGDAPLSERERQVVELAVEGLTNAEVARRLGIRPATVARILANVYGRHGLRGRAALVAFLSRIDQPS